MSITDKRILPFSLISLILISSSFSFSGLAFGAEDDDVEEIMVTSRRISESLQEVPVAVTAFNETALERIQVTTIRDLDTMVPNLFIGMNTAGPSAGAIFMRG